MARTYKPWQNRFSRSRSIATYLKRAIDADVITSSGDVEAVDSAQVQNIIRNTAVDSAAVSSISVDSSEVQNLIDSNYIRNKIGQDYIRSFIDGNYIREYIDFDFVKNTVGIDSDYIGTAAGGGAAPTITSVTPTSYNGTSGTTITVNGTNFTVGTYVDFINASGTEYRATSTTLVSQSQVTAVTPTAFSAAVDPISIKVTTNNGTATASNAVTTGSSPSWSTGTNLGSFAKNAPVDITVSASDPQSQPVTYQVKSGSALPTGLSLNSNTGNITGTLNYSISSNTSVSTIITASDTSSNTTDRTFNWTITPTSSISMSWTFPILGTLNLGPTSTDMHNWMQANLSTNGNFDDMFSAYGTGIASSPQGVYWLRPNRKVRVDYRVKGASGGRNYYARSYGGGQGRDISGSFYCNSSNYIGFLVGRHGMENYSSSYQYSASGGGGASAIFVARSGYASNSSWWYPAVIAAGGGGLPGGGNSTYWSGHDVWSALPLNFPYRTGDATGGRYTPQTYYAKSDFYVDGGAGWDYNGSVWSTQNGWFRTGASRLKDPTYSGQSGTFWNVNSYNINGRSFNRLYGGFGGGSGTWYQSNNTGSSLSYSYHAPGGGGGGYYGGYPTSFSYEGGTSAISGYLKQYPFVTYVGTGHTSPANVTNQGSNNNYYGAYSYALGLESTGTYTQDGGDVDGTAPSAGQTGNTSYGAYWDSTLPRPVDNGVVPGSLNNGSITVTISAA